MTHDRRKTSGIKTPDFLFYFANTKNISVLLAHFAILTYLK